ncbi:hypothetical protein [Cupriavidus pauculus]
MARARYRSGVGNYLQVLSAESQVLRRSDVSVAARPARCHGCLCRR